MEEEKQIIGSFGDVSLTKHDLQLIQAPNWFNDNIISFFVITWNSLFVKTKTMRSGLLFFLQTWLSFLQLHKVSELFFWSLRNAKFTPSSFCLSSESNIVPNFYVSQSLRASADPEDVQSTVSQLNLLQATLILAVVNDNQSVTPGSRLGLERGSHWSLLVFSRDTQTFYFVDSVGGRNNAAARSLAIKLNDAVQGGSEKRRVEIKQLHVVQQKNSYDCGVFCCTFLEKIVRLHQQGLSLVSFL